MESERGEFRNKATASCLDHDVVQDRQNGLFGNDVDDLLQVCQKRFFGYGAFHGVVLLFLCFYISKR